MNIKYYINNILNLFKKRGLRLSVLTVLIPILLQLIYIRYISYNVDESFFGDFILYISFIALLASSLFSISTAALTRYINQTSDKERLINEFLTLQFPLNLIGVVAIFFYSYYYVGKGLEIFLILSIYFVLLNRYSINKTIIFQLIKRKQFLNISVLEKIARFFFPLIIFYFFQSKGALLYGLLLGYFLLVLYSSFFTKGFKRKIVFSRKKVKIYFLYAYPLMFISIAVWIISLSDRYFIESYIGSSEVGIYSVIAQVSGFASILGSIFTIYVQPLIFKEFSKNKKKAMKTYMSYIQKSFFVFISAYIIFLFIPRDFFTILIRPEIISEPRYYFLFHLLVLSSLLITFITILTNVFYLNNKLHILSFFWVIAAIINLIGNNFISIYGIYAVALSKGFSYIIMLLFMLYSTRSIVKRLAD